MIPTPSLPEPIILVLWLLAALVGLVVVIVVALWRMRRVFVTEVDERFKIAIQSETFAEVVDKRVSAAFDGATGPILQGQRELAKEIGAVEKAVKRAHERIDEHLERHA